MSKDYISLEHAIRNIMGDKKEHIEEQQLDEYLAPLVAPVAPLVAPLVTTGAKVLSRTLSRTAPKILKNVDDYPAAPAAPLPVIVPLPSDSTTTDKKPAEATTTDKKPAEAPAPAPDPAPVPSAPVPSDNKKKTGLIFPGFPSLTPGQSIGVHKNAVVPVNTYVHRAGEYITHFEEKDIDRTEIENVARPKTDRNKVMARNQSIKKQIIDETSRRKKIIKDTINLKPETNDYEVNEIQEQSINWADNTPDDLRRGAFSRMSPAEIAQKLNDPYWRHRIEPYIKNINDFRTKPITPSPRDIDTSKVKRGNVPIDRTATIIDPKTGKPVSFFDKFLKFIPKSIPKLLGGVAGVAGVVLDATPAGEGSARSDVNNGIGEIDQEYVKQYKKLHGSTPGKDAQKPSKPEARRGFADDIAGGAATADGSKLGKATTTFKMPRRPITPTPDTSYAKAEEEPKSLTIDLGNIPVPTPRPELEVKKPTSKSKPEAKAPSGISDLASKRAKRDTALYTSRAFGDTGIDPEAYRASETKRAAAIQRAMNIAAQSRQEFAAKRQATVQNLRNLFQQNRQR